MDYPKITIVTPSYNQGRFIEETVLSVIGQGYPNLEFIIMDGGSTDDSVAVIKKYERNITYWVSERDEGQAHAINKGFARGTGDILAWLNSDDMYLPGTLAYISSKLDTHAAELILGNCFHFEQDKAAAEGSDVRRWHSQRNLLLADYIIQPSTFWTRQAWEKTGKLDESLTFAFDWDWFIRASNGGVTFKPDDKYLSVYRKHDAHKSGVGGEKRLKELASVYERYSGARYAQLFSRCSSHRSGIDFSRKWIGRFKVSKFDGMVLKTVFPGVFRGFRRNEVSDMMTML